MAYLVKEIFYTLQGEGMNCGKPAVFCRFSGCNLWTGKESDRAKAICKFCDTDFLGTDGDGGGRFADAEALTQAILEKWQGRPEDGNRFVVFTGGEPSLQLDEAVIDQLHKMDFRIAIETNGTRKLPAGIDWICMSPKAGTKLEVQSGNELKIVFPQSGLQPDDFVSFDFQHFLISPMDGPDIVKNTRLAIDFCMSRPKWRLSTQVHKALRIR